MRTTYTATAKRADGWWAIRVVELPGVFSQARRLEQVEGMARDAIALLLDVRPDSFDVDARPVFSDEAEKIVEEATAARAEADERQRIAASKTREAVDVLTQIGLPQRDIGRLLAVSHQRVGQLRRSVEKPSGKRRSPTRKRRPQGDSL